jgi:hypothetical protein
MRRYLIGGIAVLFLVGIAVASGDAEFTWRKVGGLKEQHVDVVTGHGKTCYVFTHQDAPMGGSVLLWCEDSK